MGTTGSYDEVFVLDLGTGERRRLTNAGSDGEAGESIVSRDGHQVAYGWATANGFELRVIGIDGSGDRLVYRSLETQQIEPQDWSADGHYILALFLQGGTSQYVVVSVADGAVRVLKRFDWAPTGAAGGRMRFSPSGRYIAYDLSSRKDSPDLDVFVSSFDGTHIMRLVEHPATDRLLGWTPDGNGILFSSDRTGTVDVWLLRVGEGKPQGSPVRVVADVGLIWPLGVTRDGALYYGRGAGVNDVYLTTLDSTTGTPQPAKKLVSQVRDNSSVDWSPDGRHLASASGSNWPEDPFVLRIRSVETGTERRLRLDMTGQHAFQPHWSPDGRALRVQGIVDVRQGLYRIDAQTGAITPILQAEPGCALCMEWPAWLRNRTVIFWRRNAPPWSIVVHDLTTGQEKELFRTVRPVVVSHLTASPNGRRLAFIWSDWDTGATALKVVPVSGGEPRDLVTLPAPALAGYGQPLFALAWTADSRHILYVPSVAGQKPKLGLWRISADGGEPQNLATLMEGLLPYGISVHPDGRRIAFTAGTEPRDEVWVLKDFLPAPKTSR
ncbi:MAG: hypothetical protein ABI785_10645 [Gemmatimonadales bacterium]